MNYQGAALAGLIIFGSVAVYAEVPSKNITEKTTKTNKSENITKQKHSHEETSKTEKKEEVDPETKRLQKKKEKLVLENAFRTEKLKSENAELLARLQKLAWEKQEITEQLAIDDLKREKKRLGKTVAYEEEYIRLTQESRLAKERASKLTSELSAKKTEWNLKTSRLNAEIAELKVEEERKAYIDSKPVYLDNPLKDDNTLVISDRRIALNGPIIGKTADYITMRINYYNNKNSKKPIFIVIDSSPGGSVMAGYRILKAMDGSKAPVYVVLKSYAASMAATIVTLAKKSFAYPNAVLLHHQISIIFFQTRLNLTQEKEHYTETEKWWKRLATPIAEKMGITLEDFIKQMYKKSSDGDWTEFASDAQKLKWVDTIVNRIEETSLLKDPNTEEEEDSTQASMAKGNLNGRPVIYLPRLSPKDMYFLYNPDQYYQLR